jgi:rhodanese-related sulfurtransferase
MKSEPANVCCSDRIVPGMILIVLLGGAIGLIYNWVGLQSSPSFGVDWISEDRTENVYVLGEEETESEPPESEVQYHDVDDPLAFFAEPEQADPDLPEIPDMDRPIQIQLPVVKKFFDAAAGVIIDARDREDYERGRIPGAINLPFETAATDPALLESIETGGRPLIIYCGEEQCEVSLELAWLMLEAGHRQVTYFEKGYQGWRDSGYPVEGGKR